MRKTITTIGIYLLLQGCLYASPTDMAPSNQQNRFEENEDYIQLAFANDVFFKTDHYFTNGLLLELQIDWLALRISDKLPFFKGEEFERRYRYTLSQSIYTPEHYSDKRINYKDRPYAGVLSISYSEDIYSALSKHTLSFKLGTIGKHSGTEKTQNSFHTVIDNELANGWENQIYTDLVVNFHYSFSHSLASSNKMDLTIGALTNLGTLNTDFGANLELRIGKRLHRFDNSGPLKTGGKNGNWYYYITTGIAPRFVLYNATLQGGLINQSNNQHVFDFDQIEHFVLEIQTGFVVGYKSFQLAFLAHKISPEFNGGKMHTYGILQLRYTF